LHSRIFFHVPLYLSLSQFATTLCPEAFLHLANLLLDFSAYFLGLAFGFQVGIVCRSFNPFLDLAIQLVNLGFNSMPASSTCPAYQVQDQGKEQDRSNNPKASTSSPSGVTVIAASSTE
jgi:hypothetical protein